MTTVDVTTVETKTPKPAQYMILAEVMKDMGPMTSDEIAILLEGGKENPIARNFSVYKNLITKHKGAVRAVREGGELRYELTTMPVQPPRGRVIGTKLSKPPVYKNSKKARLAAEAAAKAANETVEAPKQSMQMEDLIRIVAPAGTNIQLVTQGEENIGGEEVVTMKSHAPDAPKTEEVRKAESADFAARMKKAKIEAAARKVRTGITTLATNTSDEKLVEMFAGM